MSNLNTTLCISDDEKEYLKAIGTTQDELELIEKGEYTTFSDINKLIKILFTCHKMDDAWSMIKENKEIIDFNDLFTKCPFIQMDRLATDVYKYLHDNSIIDDKTYRYFEVLSGKLNDWDFWKNLFSGKSCIEMLKIINESYNNIFVEENINPYELGLVSLTKEQLDYIFGDLEEGEKVDSIFNEMPCINIEPDILRALLFNNNLQPELAGKYFGILFNIYNAMYDITDKEYTDFYKAFFESIIQYSHCIQDTVFDKSNVLDPSNIVIDMNINDIEKFMIIIDILNSIKEPKLGDEFNLEKIIINNALMITQSNRLITKYTEITEFNPEKSDLKPEIAKLLKPENYAMAVTFIMNPILNMDNMVIRYPFPGKYPAVYNKLTKDLFMNGKIYHNYDIDTDSEKLFGFIDDYEFADTINDDLFKLFNDNDAYEEFVYTMENFKYQCLND